MDSIGETIYQIRIKKNYSASQVYSGIFSKSSYRRVELGERQIAFHTLQIILSRLGFNSYFAEIVLTEDDYSIWKINNVFWQAIREKAYEEAKQQMDAMTRICEKEKADAVLHQRLLMMQSVLTYQVAHKPKEAKELVLEALKLTVHLEEAQDDILLSKQELQVLLQLLEYEIDAKEYIEAKQVLEKMLHWRNIFQNTSDKKSEHAKFYYLLACVAWYREDGFRVIEMVNHALEELKGSQYFTIEGELFYYRAMALEDLYFETRKWKKIRSEVIEDYLTAYYVFEFLDETKFCQQIKEHLGSELQWQCI
jgi:hypothetical protein